MKLGDFWHFGALRAICRARVPRIFGMGRRGTKRRPGRMRRRKIRVRRRETRVRPRAYSSAPGIKLECARGETRVRPGAHSSTAADGLECGGGVLRTDGGGLKPVGGHPLLRGTDARRYLALPERGGGECGIISPPSCELPAHWRCLPGTRRRRARARRCLRPARRRGAERQHGWRRASGRWPPRCGGRRTTRRC